MSRTSVMPCISVCIGLLASPALVHADIAGFNGLAGWNYNQGDTGSPATYSPGTDTLQITNGAGGERRSVFFETPQAISAFTASFTYQVSYTGGPSDFGAALVIQDAPAGVDALGAGAANLGYGGISNSIALSLELPDNRSGYYSGGVLGGGSALTTPVSLSAGNPLDVTVTYDGTFLAVTILDTVTLATFQTSYIAPDIASVIGSPTAYVGFTASTNVIGFGSGADQFISNPRFASVPAPGAVGALALSGLLVARRRRQ